MCVENGNWNRPRRLKPADQQWPVEALSVERNQHRALPESSRKFEQDRIFLGGITHKELFDLDPARIPPCQSDQKCNISCAPYKSGRFGIEKEPFRGIGCMTCAELLACGSGPKQKLHCASVRFVHGGSCIPLARRNVLPKTISPDLRTQGGPSRDSVLYPRIRQRFAPPYGGWPSLERCHFQPNTGRRRLRLVFASDDNTLGRVTAMPLKKW